MTRFAGHRVFVGFQRGYATEDVHLWVVGHHALVHAVEGKALFVRTPEQAAHDAPFITVNSLAIDDVARPVGSNLLAVY